MVKSLFALRSFCVSVYLQVLAAEGGGKEARDWTAILGVRLDLVKPSYPNRYIISMPRLYLRGSTTSAGRILMHLKNIAPLPLLLRHLLHLSRTQIAHPVHHLAHLIKLLDEHVDVLNRAAAA